MKIVCFDDRGVFLCSPGVDWEFEFDERVRIVSII